MRLRILFLTSVLSASLVAGCATVDVTDMAAPMAAKTEAPQEKNIVLRAAAKLYNAITNKGLAAKSSGKRVQSAANILLNGLEERDLTADHVDYASRDLSPSVIEADIRYTARHVRQTTKAAEVFLEMADAEQKMREELESLETALLAAREAFDVFSAVTSAGNGELATLKTELVGLTHVTDRFGERVRLQAAAEMAARRAEEKS